VLDALYIHTISMHQYYEYLHRTVYWATVYAADDGSNHLQCRVLLQVYSVTYLITGSALSLSSPPGDHSA